MTSVSTDDGSHTLVHLLIELHPRSVEASSLVTKDGECFSSQKMVNVIPS